MVLRNHGFDPSFPGDQVIAKHPHRMVVNLPHGLVLPQFFALCAAGEQKPAVQLRQEHLRHIWNLS
jgi:hypothetical protein